MNADELKRIVVEVSSLVINARVKVRVKVMVRSKV